jgi:hypothetical protein
MSREWRIGREFMLRHAGMPFDWLEGLGASEKLLSLAEEVLDREQDVLAAMGPSARAALVRCKPEQLPKSAVVAAWAEVVQRYTEACRDADESASEQLRKVLRTPEVAEAVFLSNPDAYHNMLLPLLAHDGPITSRWRRVRRQMYTYVQRFCAKNETVSFFGPMAYGTVGPGHCQSLRDDLPRTRRVFFSHWAAKAVIAAIARDPRMLPDLTFHTTGLPGAAAPDLLSLVSPEGSTFRDIRRALPDLTAGQVGKTLMALIAEESATVGLGGCDYDLDPLSTIKTQLAAFPASAARDRWSARIDALATKLRELSVQPLDDKTRTVAELEALFTDVTGKPARRGAGAPYADRAVFFEECASNFALSLTSDLVEKWEARISAALEACVAHGDAAQLAASRAVRAEYAGQELPVELDLFDYATRAAASRASSTSAFQAAYAPTYSGADWRAETDKLIRRGSELPGDRYAVIDLCPAAPGVDALSDADLVLSRAHHHLLVRSWLATMHPDPNLFGADAAQWVSEQDGQVVGFDFGRRNKGYYRFPGREVAMRPPSWTDAANKDLLRPWDLQVKITAETIGLYDDEGRRMSAYVPLSDFVKYPPIAALSHPQVLHPTFAADGEQPEVRIDGVVIQRSRWQVPADALAAPEPWARFLQMRRLARDTGCRFVFCRGAHERKPYLLDLASLLAADLLAHVSRGSDTLSVERMAPGPDQLWLRDAQARRYTSELRMQVVGRSAR